MRIHFIQHVPFEEPAALLQWANEKKYPVSFTRMYEEVVFPGLHQFDLLIILGGPMGVYEEEKYTWLQKRKNIYWRNNFSRKKNC